MGLLLGHRVSLRSRVGRGSVFSLELGRGTAPHAPPDPGRANGPAVQGAGLVMVVDDDEAVGVGTATLIERWGYRTLVCRSTAEALARLAAGGESPQLLIVDFRLGPGHSGREAVELIRQRLGHAVPVIIVTGDTEPMRIRDAVEAGHALLHKPVDPKRLRACIAVALPNPGDAEGLPPGQG
jgi:two-component system, sensor histidine kinase